MEKIIKVQRDELMSRGISYIKNSHVLLDIGCGIRPHDYVHNDVYIVCEPYEEYVNVLKNDIAEIKEPLFLDSCFLIINKDWSQYLDLYGDYSVDTVYLIDVIEHLPKAEGEELLRRTEKIAKQQIVIFTPLDYIEQKTSPDNKDAWGLDGASWQEHKSVWKPEDFRGKEWFFVVCDDFHEYNNIGEKLEKPVGAFWAIKNVCGNNDVNNVLDNKELFERYSIQLKKSYIKKKALLNTSKAVVEENKKVLIELEEKEKTKLHLEKKAKEFDVLQTTTGYKYLVMYWMLKEKMKGFFR